MIITVLEAKSYLKIEPEDSLEDSFITSLINASETYLTNAGAILRSTDELAKLAVKMLVTHWYENRELIGKADEIPYGLKYIIPQLKYCGGDTA